MKVNLELPINQLSLGQMSFGILREFYNRQLLPNIFPLGNVDVSAFEIDKQFADWLQYCINSSLLKYSRDIPTIKLWHLQGSERKISDRSILWTAHETDRFTKVEQNIIKNHDVVLFTSNYSANNARKCGLENVDVCPNFFDNFHFFKTDVVKPDAISFSLIGKFEKRKNSAEILTLWNKMFGKNPNYRLNCLINNHFIQQEHWPKILGQLFPQGIPWNINFLPYQEKNSQVNLIMNASDIDLSGLSGAEGFNLPCLNMLALDKIGVVLDAHAHVDYVDKGNSIKVEPSGKAPIYDGQFFVQNAPFNQGEMFVFDEDQVIEKIEQAINIFKSGQVKESSILTEFSVKNTVDKLLSYV